MGDLISVIVPVYKVEEYLDKCVQSIVDQTYQNLEIILVDDKSPDMCPEKCDEWAKKDNRIVVIHKENQGVGEARNSGLDLAHGEYITFVDSDDYLPKDAIAALYNRIQADGSELAVGKYERVFPDGSSTRASCCEWISDCVIGKMQALENLNSDEQPLHCGPWAKLYKKEILCGLRYMTLKIGEDLQLWPYILNRCNKISLVAQNVYYYFQRETSVMHIMNEQMQKDQIRSTALVAKYMLELGVTSAAQRHYVRTICYICSAEIPRREARAILKEVFSQNERKQMISSSRKLRAWSIGMYIPGFWQMVSLGKRLASGNRKK